MDEDSDTVPHLRDGARSRTFSPTGIPAFQPLTRTSTGFQHTPSSEPVIRRQRSRQFSRTSVDTDSILLDRAVSNRQNTVSDEPEETKEEWHSIALIFVALPALAGLFFENGSAVVTDVLMLGLGCLFLYWSVKWPWQWYYSTQEMKLADVDPNAEFAIVEESDDELEPNNTDRKSRQEEDKEGGTSEAQGANAPGKYPARAELKRGEAVKALQTLEIMALSSCFLSPAAVAYMLHSIRPYLSRPSGGVVSNSNLTLFVLAAELRPVLHFFRLVEERTLYLQRIVSSLPASEERQLEERVDALTKRLEELSNASAPNPTHTAAVGTIAEKQDPSPNPGTSSESDRNLRQSLQPQLDALNRAVRRYEKRATTQAIVTEARLQDLEARLKDALSLAAAASRQSQEHGLLGQASELVKWLLTKPLEALSQLFLLPFQIAGDVWRFLFGPRKRKKKGIGSAEGEGKKWAGEFKGKAARVESR